MAASDRARNGALAITALCSVQFVDVLGVTVVVTALPRMLADLRAPASSGSLVSGGYAMFFGGLLMLGARLGTGSATGAPSLPASPCSPWGHCWARPPTRSCC